MSTKTVIDGVRTADAALALWRSQRDGIVAFARLRDDAPERRREMRRVARLRWGKALDCADRFLSDCLVSDRTRGGARLKLARDVGVPQTFLLFEDDGGALSLARVVWRRGREIGCRLSEAPRGDRERVSQRMRNRYYAL